MDFLNAKNDKDVEKILKEIKSKIESSSGLDIIHNELVKFYAYVNAFAIIDVETVHDYARLPYDCGTKITYNSTIIIFDDYASTSEFLKPTK